MPPSSPTLQVWFSSIFSLESIHSDFFGSILSFDFSLLLSSLNSSADNLSRIRRIVEEESLRPAKKESMIFHDLPKLRWPRSSGMFISGKNSNLAQDSQIDIYEDEDIGCCDNGRDRKIHPHPFDFALFAGSEHSAEAIVSKLFYSISSLKSAYIQLQKAHIPYDSKNIRIADELVKSELNSISELESSYILIQRNMGQTLRSLQMEVEKQQELEQRQKYALMTMDSDLFHLRSKIKSTSQKSEEFEGLISKTRLPEVELLQTSHEWTPQLFSKIFKLASKSIHDFTKLLIHLMKESGWDLDLAASSICNSTLFAERSHKKFVFESFLSRTMLRCADDECFDPKNFQQVMRSDDPSDSLARDPDSDFGRFCRSKYLAAIPSKMEASFFANLDQRSFVMSGRHPRTQFYEAFARMARRVWALQVIASSFIPKAEIFYARRGDKFSKERMESVASAGRLGMAGEELSLEVGFTVMPGFSIGREINRCKVYVISILPVQEDF